MLGSQNGPLKSTCWHGHKLNAIDNQTGLGYRLYKKVLSLYRPGHCTCTNQKRTMFSEKNVIAWLA